MEYKEEYSVREVAKMLRKTEDDIRHLIARKKLARVGKRRVSRESVEKYILENTTVSDLIDEVIPFFDHVATQLEQKWHNFMKNGLSLQFPKETAKNSLSNTDHTKS